MNRTGLVLVGAAVAIVAYALIFSGLSTLNNGAWTGGVPVSVIDSLIPGRAPTATPSGGRGGARTGPGGVPVPPTGGSGGRGAG